MSFVAVTLDDPANPHAASAFLPLRLGGPDGLIARHVRQLSTAAESPWYITEAELITIAGGLAIGNAIFFRSSAESDGAGINFSRLTGLNGISTSDRTDLVCQFTQVAATPLDGSTWKIEPLKRGTLCESISLNGGIKKGKWQWTDAPMSLGAAVVGGGGCSSGSCSPQAASCCGGKCH